MLELVGVVFLVIAALRVLHGIPGFFSRKRSLKETWQTTVLLTGATDGIGKSCAAHLKNLCQATRLIIHGRDRTKLDLVKRQLGGETQASAELNARQLILELLQYDFADREHYEDRLERAIADIRPDTLLNCAGICYPSALYFHELPLEFIDRLITVNVITPMVLTAAVLKHRRPGDAGNRRAGSIAFIGSASSVVSEPFLTLYSATKGAINGFGVALRDEYQNSPLAVQVHVPLMVASKMSKIKQPTLFAPSADKFAAVALDAIRYAGNDTVHRQMSVLVSPYIPHYILLLLSAMIPTFLLERVRLSEQKAIRARYLKKSGNQILC